MRYFVDISTIRTASSAPPRGVTRVEYNVAREALGLGAKLVRFDEGARAFVAAELPTDFGRAHDEIALLLSETPTIRAPLLKRPGLGRARALGKSLALAALAASEAGLETARKELAWRLAYNFEFLAVAECFELASHAGALPPQPLCHEFHYWITVERGKHHASNEPGTAPPMEFTNRDKLLSLGAVWKPEHIDGLEGLASRGVTVTALIYDMIPITHTDFLPSEEMDRFKIYLERMLRSNIRLTTISRSSRQEIAKYAQNTLGLCKDVAVTPLASSASTDRAKVSAALLKAGLQDREFVFMAGSIEPRKNQGFLLDIWQAATSRLVNPPALVFAGGLAKAAYLQELRQKAGDIEGVLFFYNVGDEELAWLYENCLFTVFPSEAEGWGLPISEALDRGKYCLASDNTSLKEAGEGLVFHASLQDRQAWKMNCTSC